MEWQPLGKSQTPTKLSACTSGTKQFSMIQLKLVAHVWGGASINVPAVSANAQTLNPF